MAEPGPTEPSAQRSGPLGWLQASSSQAIGAMQGMLKKPDRSEAEPASVEEFGSTGSSQVMDAITLPGCTPETPEAPQSPEVLEETDDFGACTPASPDYQTPPPSPSPGDELGDMPIEDDELGMLAPSRLIYPGAGDELGDMVMEDGLPASVAPGSQPVVLDAPWCIDVPPKATPVPRDWPTLAVAPPRSPASWQCPVMRRIVMDEGTGAGKVWSRWVHTVEEIAGSHVAEAFGQNILPELSAVTKGQAGTGDGDVHAVLALAGADVADHEATMHQIERLVRNELPNASVALVGPEHFRNVATATKHICEQLMSGGNRLVAGNNPSKDAGDLEPDECEWPEDVDEGKVKKAGLGVFLDWFRERQARGTAQGIVLLVERTEAVPKDMLRDALSTIGNALCDDGIPVFVLFGLQHPPQDCFDLFEGQPLVNMRLLGAISLFDARMISSQILEELLEDAMCPVVLPPSIMDLLRRGVFEHTRQSVSHIMMFLAVLCDHFFAESPFGLFATPLDKGVDVTGCDLNKESLEAAWTQIFHERLKNAPELMPHFQTLWASWWEGRTEDTGLATLQAEVAQAAATAACWRIRLIASLGVWDALCCAVQPMTRHEARLRRLCRLLEELWPKESSYDATSLAEAFSREQKKADLLVTTCIEKLGADENLMSDKEVGRLLEDLVEASAGLDAHLKQEIMQLKKKASDVAALRVGIQDWFHRLRSLYWLPLEDSARIVFREVFMTKCSGGIHFKVEACLGGGNMGYTVETPLRLLAAGNPANTAPGDTTILYRLLECSGSRSVDVTDLWKTFCESTGSSASVEGKAQSALKHRFGYGLLTLHAMGLISPQAGAKSETGTNFNQWRLRKRHFGRVWLKKKQTNDDEAMSSLCNTTTPTAAEVQQSLRDGWEHEKKPVPAWAQRWLPQGIRDKAPLPSFLKRHAPARPTGFDPSAKRAKAVDKSRARIFIG